MTPIIPGPALYMVASPIGNLNDFSPRALEILKGVSLIACEDTRHSLKLLRHFGIEKPLTSLHEHNEFEKAQSLVQALADSHDTLAYLSDAGTPGISDPGSQLARAAHQAGIPVYTIPGPSAFVAALAASGFQSGCIRFDGFFPRKTSDQDRIIQQWREIGLCRVVFFESPKRIRKTIEKLGGELPPSTPVCLSREITKVHEHNQLSTLGDLMENPQALPDRGEYTVVLQLSEERKTQAQDVSLGELAALANQARQGGESLKGACKRLASQHPRFSSKDIYQQAQKGLAASSDADAIAEPSQTVSALPKIETLSPSVLGTTAQPHTFHLAKALFERWFAAGLSRKGPLHLDSSSPIFGLESWCAQVYRRGLLSISVDGTEVANSKLHGDIESLIPAFSTTTPSDLLACISKDCAAGDTVCFIDAGFASHWPEWSPSTFKGSAFLYSPSEGTKSLETVRDFAVHLRPTTRKIWTVGGGILSDIGGFLAGLFGLEHHSCPTTLLAASDASIGGKTGVNFPPFGKNQLGLFHGTRTWVVVPEFFSTLDTTLILCGLAETLKHLHLVGGHRDLRQFILGKLHSGVPFTGPELSEIISFNHVTKSLVVAPDPHEKGSRAALNLGHTVGHVLEGLSSEGYIAPLPHGLAVAMGMVALFHSGLLQTEPDLLDSLLQLIKRSGWTLPLVPDGNKHALQSSIERLVGNDKKSETHGQVILSLPPYGAFNYRESSQDLKPIPPLKTPVSIGTFLNIMGYVVDFSGT